MSLDTKFSEPVKTRRPWQGILFVVLAIITVIALALSISSLSSRYNTEEMHPSSVAPDGAGALASILRDRGVTVDLVHSADDALAGAGTILIWDPRGNLTFQERQELIDSGRNLVVVSADGWDGNEWLPTSFVDATYATTNTSRPECAVGWVSDLDAIERVSRGVDYPGCFPVGDGFHLVEADNVVYFASPELFQNEYLDRAHNAAVSIRATGQSDHLMWLMPVRQDASMEVLPSVPPALTGALIGFGLVALWYGLFVRRPSGPLIPEKLPVLVPSAEAARGRAKLYERGGNSAHAGAALRAGTIHTVSGRLGLPTNATPETVVNQLADASGWDRAAVADLFYGPSPGNERELTDLAHRLDLFTKELHHD